MAHRSISFFVQLLALVAVIVAGALVYRSTRTVAPSDARTVVASFYPLAHFAELVGGERVRVTNITPAGAEPHDFEPSAQDVATINQAGLFLYNGNGLDPWAAKAAEGVSARGGQVIAMSEVIESLPPNQADAREFDPHSWLDPILAAQEVAVIADALAASDPAHAAEYQQRAAAYIAQLQALNADFQAGLADCQLDSIVTSHTAFSYLAARYGFTQIAISGFSPDEEPSAQQLATITELVRSKGVGVIFVEELVSPKLSETIATEVGATTLRLNPIEGLTPEQIDGGATYLTEMRHNLDNLRTALVCR